MALSFVQARRLVAEEMQRFLDRGPARLVEQVTLGEAHGRVLAEPVLADRDQPPFNRSTRDGFAVKSADLARADAEPVLLEVVGEVPAGAAFAGTLAPQAAVEIMTGAPVPAGADAVVMVEHVERVGQTRIRVRRRLGAGDNVVPRASELAKGAVAVTGGQLCDAATVALLAQVGCARPPVFARPRVAIVGTGDELVGVEDVPTESQIRDSNRYSLAAQVSRAGGEVTFAGTVRDDPVATRQILARALEGSDLLLISGGVSMGKYDFVEGALAALGARVVFDAVEIRPGRPLVFGFAQNRPFFGLPGNPLSAFVTFEVFGRMALDRLAGRGEVPLCLLGARLAEDFEPRRLPLTVFLPARLLPDPESDLGAALARPVPSQGSGDLAALAAADGFLVLAPSTPPLSRGTPVFILPK